MSDTLYIKLGQSKELTDSIVTVGDVAEMQCKNKEVINKIKNQKLLEDQSHGKERYVISIMQIIEIANRIFDDVEIEGIGETECVIEFKHRINQNTIVDVIKIICVCIILFFGAGFSIMAFNNDAGIDKMFSHIVSKLSQNRHMGELIIEVSYSIGIALGIIIFYNHFVNKKLSKDPTPIEVEMKKYEKEINLTLVAESGRQNSEK